MNKDIILIAISGEEKGLWGSNYFVKNPSIQLSKVSVMINLNYEEMVKLTKYLYRRYLSLDQN